MPEINHSRFRFFRQPHHYQEDSTIISEHKISEAAALYMCYGIRIFALAMIGVFLPIFIYTLENKFAISSNEFINNIYWILSFYLMRSLTAVIVVSIFANFVFTKIGFKKAFFISALVTITYLLLLRFSSEYHFLIFIAGVLSGFNMILFWTPYHIFFARKAHSNNGKYGQRIGLRLFMNRLLTAAGPLTGALVISVFGYKTLFSLSSLLIVTTAVPILLFINEKPHHKHNPINIIKTYIFNKKYLEFTFISLGISIEDIIYATLWPIVIYTTVLNIVEVGSLTSLSLFLSSFLGIIVGKVIDKHGTNNIFKTSAIINSLIHIMRIMPLSGKLIYAIDITDRLNSNFYGVPFLTKTYETINGKNDSNIVLYREMLIHTGITVSIIFICIVLQLIALEYWRIIFLISSFLSVSTFIVVGHKFTK